MPIVKTSTLKVAMPPAAIFVMGVSGCGKTTVGERLAAKLGRSFADADHFHPQTNRQKMASGIPLTDEDRIPWLKTIRDYAREHGDLVIACSALKKSYRDLLSDGLSTVFVFLDVPRSELEKRLTSRSGHFMPASLLDSQLTTLERPGEGERAVIVDATKDLELLVEEIHEKVNEM